MGNDIPPSSLEGQLAHIGAELRAALPCAENLVVFGSARHADQPGDLDLAIIIPDSIGVFEAAL
jgi:hypothetical protein